MNHPQSGRDIGKFLRTNKWSLILLAAAALIFFAMRLYLRAPASPQDQASEYAEYELASVSEILSDSCVKDESSDGAYRGEQLLSMHVESGQYKGTDILVNNYVGPLYGIPLKKGDSASVIINTYADGNIRATVYEYNRMPALALIVALFFAMTVIVGGKTGFKSLISLVITIACLFMILLPSLLKGANTLIAVSAVCLYIIAVSFTIIGGLNRKTICAMLGTGAGTMFAMAFAAAAQHFTRISGLRTAEVEPLLQLRQSGVPLGLQSLLSAGIVISSLGAVMDVAMSISSALEEVHRANPEQNAGQLFNAGMNIGSDMVGTMTNTLILAFLGSGFTLILYLYSLGLSKYQLLTSAYVSIEAISGIASSIGMILAIPLTAFISARLLSKDRK